MLNHEIFALFLSEPFNYTSGNFSNKILETKEFQYLSSSATGIFCPILHASDLRAKDSFTLNQEDRYS